MIALSFLLLFAISGICVSGMIFKKEAFRNRIWLGLAIGLLMLTWLPPLFAFAVGFTKAAQLLSAIVAVLLIALSVFRMIRAHKSGFRRSRLNKRDLSALFVIVPILLICFSLLNTHILYPHANGSIWVGQVTYGDLAMHLGFMTSIAEQTAFPPQYSIFPGHALNYPFLCETSGASLFQLGMSVRWAYILSAAYAFVVVVLGVYCFFRQWLKKNSRALFATILFFFGGGFGFLYFFDLSKTGGLLAPMLHIGKETVSQSLLDGFYLTPTNIPALGLRWVNPIVDMLIPQRATLFGWAFLFPCLYLLHGFVFEQKRSNLLPLGVIAGLLPMIHTHSFLALGIVSATWFVIDLISVRFKPKRLFDWLIYGGIACALAAPQLILFTFRQTSESGMVHFHLNWANTTDSYLWFYIKNLGLIFLLMPFAFLILPKRDKKIYAGALVLWLIAELIEFQPNDYDNNKLLFIWYAFTCGMVAKLLFVVRDWILHIVRKRYSAQSRRYAHRIGITVLMSAIVLYFVCKLAFDSEYGTCLLPGTALTLFFAAGLLLSMCIGAWRGGTVDRKQLMRLCIPTAFSCWLLFLVLFTWLTQYQSNVYAFSRFSVFLTIISGIAGLLLLLLAKAYSTEEDARVRFSGVSLALTSVSFLLVFTFTASSTMTILRELKSEYQVYTNEEASLSEQIRSVTEPDAIILANSYHWNVVTPLTGRSIVTGTGTFLYYHGIDTSEREQDVALMFENPSQNEDLFRKYGVTHVLLTNAERMTYDVDYSYFAEHGTVVAQNSSGMLYRWNP